MAINNRSVQHQVNLDSQTIRMIGITVFSDIIIFSTLITFFEKALQMVRSKKCFSDT